MARQSLATPATAGAPLLPPLPPPATGQAGNMVNTAKPKKGKTANKDKTDTADHQQNKKRDLGSRQQNGDDIPVPQYFDSRALDFLDDTSNGPPARSAQPPATAAASKSGGQAGASNVKQKKRKHQNEETGPSPAAPASASVLDSNAAEKNSNAEPKKKKSKKDNVVDQQEQAPNPANNEAATQANASPATAVARPAPVVSTRTEAAPATSEKNSKKSKKDKIVTQPQDTGTATATGGMQVHASQVTVGAAEAEAGAEARSASQERKEKKKKPKEIDGVPETPEQRAARKQRKEEKKAKKAAKAQAKAAKSAKNSTAAAATSSGGVTAAASHQQSASSHLPDAPTAASSSTMQRNASQQVVTGGYENIDPALWPTPVRPAPARSVSVAGSTSILPRDPSLAPGDPAPIRPASQAPQSGSGSGSTNNAGTVEGNVEAKKRGRPKKAPPPGLPDLPAFGAAGQSPSTNGRTIAPASSAPGPSSAVPQPIASTSSARTPGTGASSASNRPASTSALPTAASASTRPSGTTSIAPSRAPPSQRGTSTGAGGVYSAQHVPPPPPASSAIVTSIGTIDNPSANANTAARAALNPDFEPTPIPANVPPLAPSENSSYHQELLATRWLSARELAELVEREGLKYRAGKFTKAEDAVLKNCMDNYRDQQKLTDEQIYNIVNTKGKDVRADYGDFWIIMARCLPDRPLMSLYHHIKRITQPGARQGTWTAEQDAKLKAAYKLYGPQWELISPLVGRWGADCRDRWRNYLHPGQTVNKGTWSREEEDKLRSIVTETRKELAKIVNDHGTVALEDEPVGGSEMFWTRVAKKMVTRSRHQCRIKWNDHMKNKILAPDGKPIRWAKRDNFLFIMKLHSLNVRDESDIAWKLLPDSHWNWWSPHILQKRWVTLKARAIRGLKKKDATYSEIVNWLKAEQDAIPRKRVKMMMARWRDHTDILESGAEDEEEDRDAEGEPSNAYNPRFDKQGKSRFTAKPFRTSEFVQSEDDEEDGDDDQGEGEDEQDEAAAE